MTPPTSSSLFSHLETLPDPRRANSVDHPLPSVLFIAVAAVICGADGWTAIAEWGKAKESWLSTFLDLPHGIPSHDTFRRVFSVLSPVRFSEAFQAWMAAVVVLTKGAVVAIDGKSLRRSRCAAEGLAALHIVSAFAADNGVVLGQVKTDAKSNEITAIPELLALLDVSGCLVTLDAMGCQKAIAAQIVDQGGDYLIAVKGNQPTLQEITEETVSWGMAEGIAEVGGSYAKTVERRAGQQITREVWVMPAPDDLVDLEAWTGLRSMVLARRTVVEAGEESIGQRRFISTCPGTAAPRILHGVRRHWGIENQLHWSLDVAFDEDHCRIRDQNAAQNMARLRHIALNLLKAEKTAKVGIKIKRSKAGWDNNYLVKVMGGAR